MHRNTNRRMLFLPRVFGGVVKKQYTNESQTAKLIELGFEKPKSIIDVWGVYETDIDMEYEYEYAYSIGELIEMLPPKIDGRNLVIERYKELGQWLVCYESCLGVYSMSAELSDALYDMVIKLKEEGVI